MTVVQTDAVVLRTIRYSEADVVLTLLTRDAGRGSAIAKGARRPRSRLGGRLQPGVCVRLGLARGRGSLAAVRGASVIEPHAGLWASGYRLRAAGCVLEAAARTLPDELPDEGAYHLMVRALGLLAGASERPGPPRLDPLVLGTECKLLVVAGLVPMLGECVACGAGPPLSGFSAARGGALCARCSAGAEPVEPQVLAGLAALLARPLAQAPEALEPGAAPGVERLIGLLLREHLGVTLRSALAPG